MNWLQFLLQVNLYLVLFYGFYRLLLHNETFYNLNRIYLVGVALLAFLIPLWHSDLVQSWFVTQQVQATYSVVFEPTMIVFQKPIEPKFTWQDLIRIGYFLGIAFFVIRLIIKLLAIKNTFQKPTNKAFSFFNKLFVSEDLLNRETILTHERVHARQLHSVDVLLFEIVGIICWFNPIIYFYKQAIKHIHEFIADEIAAQKERSKADYAMLLFSQQFGVKNLELTNSFFNQSLLKRRIMMLSKPRSRRTALLKYGFSVPLFIGMLIISSATVAENRALSKVENIIKNESDSSAFISKNTDSQGFMNSEKLKVSENLVCIDDDTIANDNSKDTLVVVGNRNQANNEEVFTSTEQAAEFPGGVKKMYEFLGKNIKYPIEAQRKSIQGKVFIKFIVTKTGEIRDATILKGIGNGCDEEAIRVIYTMPKWTPAMQKGEPVNAYFTMPIVFFLEPSIEGLGKTVEIPPLKWSKSDESKTEVNLRIHGNDVDIKDVMFVVNGVIVDDLSHLKPDNIDKMDVIKGEEAVKIYGEKAKNGVIKIITKSDKVKPKFLDDVKTFSISSRDMKSGDLSRDLEKVFEMSPEIREYAYYEEEKGKLTKINAAEIAELDNHVEKIRLLHFDNEGRRIIIILW